MFNDSDHLEIILKGASYILIKGAGLILSYAFTIFITKSFGASIFGLFSWCLAIFMIVSVIGRLGIDINIVKHYSSKANQNDIGLFVALLLFTVILSGLLSLGIFFFRHDLIYLVFKDSDYNLLSYLNWILLSIPFWSGALVCSGIPRARANIKMFTFISLTSRFLFGFLLLLLFSFFSTDAIIIAKAHFYGVLITFIIALINTYLNFTKKQWDNFNKTKLFLRESFPMMLSSSILILLGWIDTFVLGIFESDTNVGIYNVCIKIATITTFTLLAINSILAPKVANYYREQNITKYKALIKFSTKLNFYVSSLIILVVLFFNGFFLSIFGAEFIAGKAILFILIFGQFVNSFSGSVGIILQMIGKQKVYQNFLLIALVLNILITLLLTPIYGGIGAAIATVISMAFWNLASVIYLKQKMQITSYYNPVQEFREWKNLR